MKHLTINPLEAEHPTRDHDHALPLASTLPDANSTKLHPTNTGGENASLFFVGTATTILYASSQILDRSFTVVPFALS